MKQFSQVVYGGIFIIFILAVLYRGGAWLANYTRNELPKAHLPSLSDIVRRFSSKPDDGTDVDGMKRQMRYSASEEEDLINNASGNVNANASGDITASAYILRNLKTGTVVASHNADKLLPIASVTKLVTAVIARKFIEPNEHVYISQRIVNTYGNTAGFAAGETMLASDLQYPLLMVSSNDAAEALAQNYGRKQFIVAMNDFAQSIGAYRTYFADPSGLSPENCSSATDIAIVMDWIRKNDPDILKITDTKSITIRDHTWVNPTHFLNWSNFEGGKNGYIPEANKTGTMIFAMGQAKDPYVVVVLGSDMRDNDIVNLLAKVGGK